MCISDEEFKQGYISYTIMEALSTTSPEDREETIAYLEDTLNNTPITELYAMAYADGFLDYI